jgi:hypothetical protein
VPVVKNNMISNQSTVTRTAEGRTVLLDGLNVKFRADGLGIQIPSRYVLTSGSVAPNQGETSVGATILQSADMDALRGAPSLGPGGQAQLTATVSLEGHMTDGGHITSSEVSFPITVCRGCLRITPPSNICTAMTAAVMVCNIGQDSPVDCATYDANMR